MTTGPRGTLLLSTMDTMIGASAFLQLHTGDPGAAGTANVAGINNRKAATLGAASLVAGIATKLITNTITWTSAETDTNETIRFFTLWTTLTSGLFIISGVVGTTVVSIGDTVVASPGTFKVTSPAAA